MIFAKLDHLSIRDAICICYHYVFNNKKAFDFYKDNLVQYRQEIDSLKKKDISSTRYRNFIKINLKFKSKNIPVLLRKKSSDLKVYEQVFESLEYNPIVKSIAEKTNSENLVIVDLGANIGMASMFFCFSFEKSIVFAVEPDKENHKSLVANIGLNKLKKRIIPLNKAIWSNSKEKLQIDSSFRDGESWSRKVSQVMSSDSIVVDGMTIAELADVCSIKGIIHLLKIDVEGTEFVLFGSNDFLAFIKQRVLFLCIEIHEEVGDFALIIDLLKKMNFDIKFLGETFFCENKGLLIDAN